MPHHVEIPAGCAGPNSFRSYAQLGSARQTEQHAVAGSAAINPDTATGSAAALLKTAADKQALVPKGEIFKAIKALDKAKLKVAAAALSHSSPS
jgi:hypothetical protein